MKMWIKAICSVIAIVGLFVVLLQDAAAETKLVRTTEQAVAEESTRPAECTLNREDPARPSSPLKGVGCAINGFFAFGCKVNYDVYDWILSDKCDTRKTRLRNRPCCR